jgi:methanogenic corrinoid protein MtbC1
VADSLAAGLRLDGEAVYRTLLRALLALRPRDFMSRVVGPLLRQVGERWHRGELMAAQEHAMSVAVGRVLTFVLSAHEPERGAPVLLSTTVAGEAHEFGAMQASVVAAEAGWHVLYLGPSLPAAEIAEAARLARAGVVVVSAIHDDGSANLVTELEALRRELPSQTRLVVGGAAGMRYRAAIDAIAEIETHDLDSFRKALPQLRRTEVSA